MAVEDCKYRESDDFCNKSRGPAKPYCNRNSNCPSYVSKYSNTTKFKFWELVKTADLIAELVRRQPCEKCKSSTANWTHCACEGCYWQDIGSKNNFEAKEKQS